MLTPYHFFLKHAGYGYDPARETRMQGRIRCAQALAAAEKRALADGLVFHWEVDPEITSADWVASGEDGGPDRGPWDTYVCVMYGTGAEDCSALVLASLGGVDFGRDGSPYRDPYARVMQAELALEHYAALDNRNPCA